MSELRITSNKIKQKLAMLLCWAQLLAFPLLSQTHKVTPIAFYSFSGNARDESGKGNHGEIFGATGAADRFGRARMAFRFSGKEYVRIPSQSLKNNEYTYSVWAYPEKLNGVGEGSAIFSIGDNTGRNQSISLVNDYSRSFNTGWSGAGTSLGTRMTMSLKSGTLPVLYRWYHIVTVRAVNSMLLYVNGELVDQVTFLKLRPFYGDPTSALIGLRANYKQGFIGLIDDLEIYNLALSASDVGALYKRQSAAPAGAQKPK